MNCRMEYNVYHNCCIVYFKVNKFLYSNAKIMCLKRKECKQGQLEYFFLMT